MKDGPKLRSFKKIDDFKTSGFQSKEEKTESRSTTTVNNPTRNEENQPNNPRYLISINPIIVKNPACPIIQNTSPYTTTRLGLLNAQITPKKAAIDSNEKTPKSNSNKTQGLKRLEGQKRHLFVLGVELFRDGGLLVHGARTARNPQGLQQR